MSFMPSAPPRLDELVEQRDQAVAAFEREALLADVLRVQIALEAVGLRQLLEDVLLLLGAEAELAAGALELLVHPAPLFGVGDVHELGADRARRRSPSAARRDRAASGAADRRASRWRTRCRGRRSSRPWNAGSRSGADGRGSRPSASRSDGGNVCSRSSGSSFAARCPRERYAVTSFSTPACLCACASLTGAATAA